MSGNTGVPASGNNGSCNSIWDYTRCSPCRRHVDEREALDDECDIQKHADEPLGLSYPSGTPSDKNQARQITPAGEIPPLTLPAKAEQETKAAPAVSALASKTRVAKAYINTYKAMRAFQSAVKKPTAPTQTEVSLGVIVERVYDFYDPVTHNLRVRKMQGDVVHQRPQLQLSEPGSGSPRGDASEVTHTGNTEDWASQSQASSPRSETSGVASRALSDASVASPESPKANTKADRPAPKSKLMRNRSLANPEATGRWGVIVGKVLHSRVIDFTALKDKAIHKHRIASSRGDAMIGRLAASVQGRAGMVVGQARELCKRIAKESTDKLDSEWNDPGLLSYLFSTEYIDMLMLLATTARRVIATQPVLAVVHVPCRVFGDIHGQLRDLLLLLRAFGFPKADDEMTFVFNGDFVDRGKHQLAVIGLLLALKVEYPDKVWLIRGNHEDRMMNEKYGFRDECVRLIGDVLGPKLFDLMENVFDQLPVACLISERIFVVHGGIGDGMWKLDDLRTLKRPLRADSLMKEELRWVFNMLWSDPIEDGKSYDPSVFGVHESPRGEVTSQFAWNITKMFCARNGLSLIVRSHQSKKGSRGFDIMHDNMLIRVFSARDYEGHGNDGAVLVIQEAPSQEAPANSNTKLPLVTVRPQVLRSVTKARAESRRRQKVASEDSGSVSGSEPLASIASPRIGGEKKASGAGAPYSSDKNAFSSDKNSDKTDKTDKASNKVKRPKQAAAAAT
mmetsp:Transcript_60078/g.143131  ORF Transcript_60078/g.143131 Transcript_60078/m.143131 type:complete len:735 (-) Transcript_60078:78-2282(-)